MLSTLFKIKKRIKEGEIILGYDKDKNKPEITSFKARSVGSVIIRSVGSGSTSALSLPILNQDLDHMVSYINSFPASQKLEGVAAPKINGQHLNAISVIESSNSLCQRTLKLAKAHGIPDEAIAYINPLDADTASINPMIGPVDAVAVSIAGIIVGVHEKGLHEKKEELSQFEKRNMLIHIKQFVYLLKLQDFHEELTLDSLFSLYKEPSLAQNLVQSLKQLFLQELEVNNDEERSSYRKEAQDLIRWFEEELPTATNFNPLYDKVIDDVSAVLIELHDNPLVRRVLFGRNVIDFERHVKNGGLLLVSTAKAELPLLSSVVGQFVLMNLQHNLLGNPNERLFYHHILVDEAEEYLYKDFLSLTALSRRHKVILTLLQQTLEGNELMRAAVPAIRNRIVYGEIPVYDASSFIDLFEGNIEQFKGYVQPIQEAPNSTAILINDEGQIRKRQLKHRFLAAEAYTQSKHVVDKQAAADWLEWRRFKST